MKLAIAVLALAACGDPPTFSIEYALTNDPDQRCVGAGDVPAVSCSDVAMPCQSVLSVRIFSPSDPTTPFVSQCEPIVGREDLCSIAGINLPQPTGKIPAETLEIDVAVYADMALDHDANGDPICPTDVMFAPNGLPVAASPSPTSPSPAVGGRAFYHPGDSTTVVTLGCTDESQIQDPSCVSSDTVAVTATVDDFDTQVAVPPTLADQLNVLVGEPQPVTVGSVTSYELSPSQTRALDRTIEGPIPGWGASIDLKLVATACLEVLEDVPQATPSLTCKKLATLGPSQVDLTGVRLAKSTLDEIIAALPTHAFPTQGLVVGIVVDQSGNPVSGIGVVDDAMPMLSTIDYLTDNRQLFQPGSTGTSGIFIATATPYGTTFSVPGRTATGVFGGLVAGKVTIVVLQLSP